MAQNYRFKKEHEDAVIQLPTIKYPITKDNLTDHVAKKILKLPALAHNIEPINPEERKQLKAMTEGTEVDDFGNRVLSEELRSKVDQDLDPEVAAALANAKPGEIVGIQEGPNDIFVDEPVIDDPDEPGDPDLKPDPKYPVKKEVSHVSPKSIGTPSKGSQNKRK